MDQNPEFREEFFGFQIAFDKLWKLLPKWSWDHQGICQTFSW